MKQLIIRNHGVSDYICNYGSTAKLKASSPIISDHQRFLCEIQKVQMAREGLIRTMLKHKMEQKKKLQSYLYKKMIVPRALKQNYSEHHPLNLKALKLSFRPLEQGSKINIDQQKSVQKYNTKETKEIKRKSLKNGNKWKIQISHKNIHNKYFRKKSDHSKLTKQNNTNTNNINTINNQIDRHYKTACSVNNRRTKPQSVHCEGNKFEMAKWKLSSFKGITSEQDHHELNACYSKDQIMTTKYFLLPTY